MSEDRIIYIYIYIFSWEQSPGAGVCNQERGSVG